MNVLGVLLVMSVQAAEIISGKNFSECDKYLTRNTSKDHVYPAIINGYVANLVEFPYAVRIYVRAKKDLISCTGVTISRRLVLTAGHCVVNGGSMIVVTGNANQDDYLKGKSLSKYARYQVRRAIVHPKMDAETAVHDIALLVLARDMIHPTYGAINPSYERLTKPEKGTIFGWGGTQNNSRNNELYGKHLKVENCTNKRNGMYYLCLMEEGICHGDSGGGMIINNSVYGIASFHVKQNPFINIHHYYFYTALSEEEDFLKDAIKKNEADSNYGAWLLILTCSTLLCAQNQALK